MKSMVHSTKAVGLAITAAILALAVPGAAGAAGPASANAAPASPDQVTLSVVAVNGSGCPAGTANVTAIGNGTGFRITYSDFVAQDGGSAAAVDSRQNCQVGVQVNVPQGFTFAVAEADYRGKARLAAGASGLQRTNYYLQGSPDNNFVDHSFTGPMNGTWQTTDRAAVPLFAPCSQSTIVNVNTELRVDAGSSNPSTTSSLSMVASDGSVDTVVQFQWAQC